MIGRLQEVLKTSIFKLTIKYTNNELVKVSSKNLIQVLIKLLLGFLNIKVISVMLGSSGMAVVSQFFNVIQFFSNLANGGIIHGVTKLTAQYDYSIKRVKLIIGNSFILTIVFSVIISIFLFCFAETIAVNFLYDHQFTGIVRGAGFLAFSLAMNSILLAFLNGLQQNRKFILLNSYSAIIAALVMIPFVYFGGIRGAFFAQYISSFIILGIGWFMSRKQIPRIKELVYIIGISKRLLLFGLMILIASSLKPLTKIVARNIIVNLCSIHEAGWWDGINKISLTFHSVITSALALYFLPRISKLSKFEIISKEIRNSMALVVPLVLVLSILLVVFKDHIITVIFTEQFRGMKDLFLFQFIGDVIRVVNWFLIMTVILKEKVKSYIILELLMAIVAPLNVYFFVKEIGIVGVSYAYALSALIYFLGTLVVYLRMVNDK